MEQLNILFSFLCEVKHLCLIFNASLTLLGRYWEGTVISNSRWCWSRDNQVQIGHHLTSHTITDLAVVAQHIWPTSPPTEGSMHSSWVSSGLFPDFEFISVVIATLALTARSSLCTDLRLSLGWGCANLCVFWNAVWMSSSVLWTDMSLLSSLLHGRSYSCSFLGFSVVASRHTATGAAAFRLGYYCSLASKS